MRLLRGACTERSECARNDRLDYAKLLSDALFISSSWFPPEFSLSLLETQMEIALRRLFL
jgi:hypothetical protein